VSKHSSPYPRLSADVTGTGVVSHAGLTLLLHTAEKTGLIKGLSKALAPWRKALAVHDPGKIILDLAVAVAAGGDHLCDIAVLRAEPGVFGHVASDPTVSRTIATLAADAPKVVSALRSARHHARARAWRAAGAGAPDHAITAADPLVIDLDATIVISHSDKQAATATWKKTFGHHPLGAWADHGQTGTGEPLVIELREGKAGSNTAADHRRVLIEALKQLPFDPGFHVGRKVLVRADSGGGTHEFVDYLTRRRLQYSVGFTLTETTAAAVDSIPEKAWTPAYDSDEDVRDGAWVAELTGLIDLSGWPPGMRVIVRKERAHPGAQLRFTDRDGLRLTAFATNTTTGQLPVLELQQRRRARCEDRIRSMKDTGLRGLPLQGFDQNRIWIEIACLATELITWMQILTFDTTPARRWAPKTLRLRLFSAAARIARHARHARQVHLRFSRHWPWTELLLTATTRLQAT
jgi:hypothetical protein